MITLSNLKIVLETIGKIKQAFEGLRSSNLFLKETDVYNLIEQYFGLQQMPNQKVKLVGRISNYTLNNSFPIYTPAHLTGVRQEVQPGYSMELKRRINQVSLTFNVTALNVPALAHKPIELPDKSLAKILWLYNGESEGLVYPPTKEATLTDSKLCELFGIDSKDKPLPILVDLDFPQHSFYKIVEVVGTVISAPIDLFRDLASHADAFVLNYFSNCFRPFSDQDGILAIDARNNKGSINVIRDPGRPFRIIYTVQGSIGIPSNSEGKDLLLDAMNKCIDSIPGRQGLGPMKAYNVASNNSDAIVSMGETCWQKDQNNSGIAAFKEIDVTDRSYSQAAMAELANNWQVWQKTARNRIRRELHIEPKITPLICSNPIHDKSFHPNGLQIARDVEEKLLSSFPEVRKSIDWLGISVGKQP